MMNKLLYALSVFSIIVFCLGEVSSKAAIDEGISDDRLVDSIANQRQKAKQEYYIYQQQKAAEQRPRIQQTPAISQTKPSDIKNRRFPIIEISLALLGLLALYVWRRTS